MPNIDPSLRELRLVLVNCNERQRSFITSLFARLAGEDDCRTFRQILDGHVKIAANRQTGEARFDLTLEGAIAIGGRP